MKSLNIKTLDGGDFRLDWEVIQKSQTIKTMVEDLGIDQDSMGEDTIPLSNEEVTSEVFAKVLDWLEHYRGKPDPAPKEDEDDEDDLFKPHKPIAPEDLDAWQTKYIAIPVPKMFPLLICANFLEIRGLLDLMAKAVALQMQGKTVEEMRKNLDLPDPCWTEEELQKLREESAWANPDTKN